MPGQERNPFEPKQTKSEVFLDTASGSARTPAEGNRPAAGARQATPGEVLAEDFAGGQNAGDFLGLDLEFDAAQPGGQPAAPAGGADFYGLDLAGVPAPAPVPPVVPAYAPVGHVEADPSVFPVSRASAPPAEEEPLPADEELEFEPELERDQRPAGGRRMLFAGALGVALLAVAGVMYGPQLLERFGPSEEVARNPRPPRNARGERPGTTTAPATANGATSTDVGADPAQVLPVEDLYGAGTEVATATPGGELWSSFPGSGETEPAGVEVDPLEALTSFLHDNLQPAPTANTRAPRQLGDPGVEGGFPNGIEPFGEEFLQGLGWASGDSLHVSWAEAEIPMDALHSPIAVMMPHVGPVRVHMDSGEVFEGRMVAMGEERVWIDTEPGRIGLDGAHVARIDRMPEIDGNVVASGDVATGNRVCLRVPGGVLYGRVLALSEGRITVVTDDGAKITVTNPEIEEVGSSRVRLVTQF